MWWPGAAGHSSVLAAALRRHACTSRLHRARNWYRPLTDIVRAIYDSCTPLGRTACLAQISILGQGT